MSVAPTEQLDRRDRFNSPFSTDLKPLPGYSSNRAGNDHTNQHAYFNLEESNAAARQIETSQTVQKPYKLKSKYKPKFISLDEKNKTKNKLCVLLGKAGAHLESKKMRDCNQIYSALVSDKCLQSIDTFHCSNRFCPFCAEYKAQERINNYLPKVKAFYAQNANLKPIHLVLTQKHKKGEILSDSIKRLLTSIRKVIRRKFWKDYLGDGGVYAVEFTVGRDGNWHTHAHLLLFRRRFFDVKLFRAEWLKVTGDSVNFKIAEIRTLQSGLEEIVGYLSKPADVDKFTVHHVRQLLDLSGVRLFAPIGKFRTFCADEYEAPEAEPTTDETKLSCGDLCPCHGLPLKKVSLDIRERIELEQLLFFSRQIEKLERKDRLIH